MCVFVLQTLSTEAKFGVSLNKQFEGQSSLPASVQIPLFSGSYADYLIIVSLSSIQGLFLVRICTDKLSVHIHVDYNQ
jgi:hypothetical protein